MFRKKGTVDFTNFDTLIGKNSSFEGNLKAEGVIRIDGQVKGEVEVEGDIFIGEGSEILGNIRGVNVVVGGNIKGNVIAREQLQLTSTGKIAGDISIKSLIIDENGIFEGRCKMEDTQGQTIAELREVMND